VGNRSRRLEELDLIEANPVGENKREEARCLVKMPRVTTRDGIWVNRSLMAQLVAQISPILAHTRPSGRTRARPIIGRMLVSFLTILAEAKAPHERAGWKRLSAANPSEQLPISLYRTYGVLELEGSTSFDPGHCYCLRRSPWSNHEPNHVPKSDRCFITRLEPDECE
jgi:hypothetical protein